VERGRRPHHHAEDRATWAIAEQLTDRIVLPAYAVLDEAGRQALLAGLDAMESALAPPRWVDPVGRPTPRHRSRPKRAHPGHHHRGPGGGDARVATGDRGHPRPVRPAAGRSADTRRSAGPAEAACDRAIAPTTNTVERDLLERQRAALCAANRRGIFW